MMIGAQAEVVRYPAREELELVGARLQEARVPRHRAERQEGEGDGEAEIHETQVDVVTVISGEATLLVGGTLADGHQTAPGEIRGEKVTGATSHKMAPGDVFHIPAKVPHQMLVPKDLVIQVVKVDSK